MAVIHSLSFAVSLSGVVTTDDRTPISDATVQIVRDERIYLLPSQLQPIAETRTDAQGKFIVSFPNAEGYSILASAPGRRIMKFSIPRSPDAAGAVGLALEAGVQVEGVVKDSTNRPVPNVEIGPVIASIDMERAIIMRTIPQWLKAGPDGAFRIDHLMPGVEYQFLVRGSGYEVLNARVYGGKQPVTLKLRNGGNRLTGGLFTAKPSAQPYDYATIPVRLNGNGFDYVVMPKSDGAFEFYGIPEGTYSLEPILPPDRAARPEQISMPRDAETSKGLELPTGFFASGAVYDADTSSPVSGVGLEIFDVGTTSGTGGEFRVGPLWRMGTPEVRLLDETAWRFATTPQMVIPDANGYDDLTDLRLFVKRGRTVNFEILNFPTTETVSVHLLKDEQAIRRTSVSTSTVALTVFDTGDYVAFADASNSSKASQLTSVSLTAETSVSVRLTMGECAIVEGTAVRKADTETTAVPRPFEISLRTGSNDTSSALICSAGTDRNNTFRLPCVPPGSYVIRAKNAAGTRTQEREITLGPGMRERVDFEFPAGNDLAGRVLDADTGNPMPGVEVRLHIRYPDGRGMLHKVETGTNGTFAAADIDVSKLAALQIDHDGYTSVREADIALPRTDLVVRLKPLPGVMVMVQAAPDSQWRINLIRGQDLDSDPSRASSSQVLEFKSASGGVPVKFGLPGWNRYYFHAQAVGQLDAISEPVVWSSFEPPPAEVVLVPGATGSISCNLPPDVAVVEVSALNMVLPDGGGAGTEFRSTPEGGRCALDGLPPGDYVVLAGVLQPEFVPVRPGKTSEVTMKPRKLGEIAGTVKLRGTPVVGCEVELRGMDEKVRVTKTNSEGAFAFPDMAPGHYYFVARMILSSGDLSIEREVVLPPDKSRETVEIDLTTPESVPVILPQSLQIKPGTVITFMNLQTRQTTAVRWEQEGPEAAIGPGSYEVWREDQVIGTADFVSGKVEVKPKE